MPLGLEKEEMELVFGAVQGFVGEEGEEILEMYHKGDIVTLISGPFKFCPGEVTEVRGRRLLLDVNLFGKITPLECDQSIVELQRKALEVESENDKREEEDDDWDNF